VFETGTEHMDKRLLCGYQTKQVALISKPGSIVSNFQHVMLVTLSVVFMEVCINVLWGSMIGR